MNDYCDFVIGNMRYLNGSQINEFQCLTTQASLSAKFRLDLDLAFMRSSNKGEKAIL